MDEFSSGQDENNESWVLIGYASEQDGPILPTQDFPHQFCREKFSSVAI